MRPPRGALFLERETYRRRRVMDGARILPVLGFVLVLLPVLWSRDDGSNVAAEAVYLFVLWCVLILAAALLARLLRGSFKREALPRASAAAPVAGANERDSGAGESADIQASTAAPEPPR